MSGSRLMLLSLGLAMVVSMMSPAVVGQPQTAGPPASKTRTTNTTATPAEKKAGRGGKDSALTAANAANPNNANKRDTNPTVSNNLENTIRQLTQEFMTLRQQRRGEQLRRFYSVDDIARIHDFLIYQYTSIKLDLKKGSFTPQYVRRSIEESDFVDVYKEAFLNYLFKDRDLNQELDQAFTKFLGSYKYSIPRFQINKIRLETTKKTVYVDIIEYRLTKGEKEAQPQNRTLQWYSQDGKWYLTTDKPANY